LALAIAALHQAGKVHRDIKPSNILVTRDDRLVLLDFGLVAEVGGSPRDSSQRDVVGTAMYMAPEQAHGRAVGPAADWYSFGVLLYEALTGRPPHVGPSALEILTKKQQYEPPPPRARTSRFVPRDLDGLCADLLSRNPADRPSQREILERIGAEATPAP